MTTARKNHLLRNSILILLVFAIAGLALTAVLFFNHPEPTSATATIEFTFEGAAAGIAPNGAKFNLFDITSEEVLSAALAECSMDGDYTVEQIANSLVTRGVYPDDMVQQVTSYESLLDFSANHSVSISSFHPTAYNVKLYNDFDPSISEEKLMALLKGIMSAYKAYFVRTYANQLAGDVLPLPPQDFDYAQQLAILQSNYETVANYALELYTRRPSFIYEQSGFNDIRVRLNSLIDTDVSRLKAQLTLNALSKDADRLKSQYEFEIDELENHLERQRVYLTRLDKLIDSYEKNGIVYLNSGNSVTKIDNNASATYDKLISQRNEVADSITTINNQIITNQQMLADLTDTGEAGDAAGGDEEEAAPATAAMTEAQRAELEESIAAVEARGSAIVEDFQAMLVSYNAQEINDLTVTVIRYEYDTPRILSGAFVVLAFKTAGPIFAIGFMLCMVMIIISRRREERQ